jgi:hypothetical protein
MKDPCAKIRDKLSAYLDGELTPKEMAEVAAHLEACPECAALLDKMRRLDDMAGTAIPDFDDELMELLTGRIMDGIDKAEAERAETGPKPKVIPIWYRYVAVAASIVIVFLAGRLAFKETGGDLLRPSAQRGIKMPEIQDTTMPYQKSESESRVEGKTKKQAQPPERNETETLREKSASVTAAKGAAQMMEKPALSQEMEELPAPTTIESPPPTEEAAADHARQAQNAPSPKMAVGEEGKKSESTGKVAGRVVDAATGEPLYGVSVQLRGTVMGAKTNIDGDFTILSVPPDTYNLVYSSPGYESTEYTEVPVYPGGTEELTVAMKQSVLETGKMSEVLGTRKAIDFIGTDTGQIKSAATAPATAAREAADEAAAHKLTLPEVDSLDDQYASILDNYGRQGQAKELFGITETTSAPASKDSIRVLRHIIDSLNTRIAETSNFSDRIRLTYLRVRAAFDMYRMTKTSEDSKSFNGYKKQFEEELSELKKQGYNAEELNDYGVRIEELTHPR